MSVRFFLFSIFFIYSLASQAELKQDYFSLPKVVAIEERQYDQIFEVSVALGYLPSNAYNRYFSGSVSGIYKFASTWSWELFRYDLLREEETSLKDELENEFAINVSSQDFGGRFLPMTQIIRTGLMWEPFYNKGLFNNSSLVYSNLSFVFNLGSVSYESRTNQFLAGLGAIFKVFFSQSLAGKIDLRQSFVFDTVQGTTDFTEINFGIGYHFGGSIHK